MNLLLDIPTGGDRLDRSFVVRPHSENFHDWFFLKDLVYQSVLDCDPARVDAGQITNKFLVSGRIPKWIPRDNVQQIFDFRLETGIF